MIQFKSVGGKPRLQLLVLAAVLGSLVPGSAFAGNSLAEFLNSRAGRLIFSELVEGSIAANRILGTHVANPLTRMERLAQALGDSRLSASTTEVESRINRIYEKFSAQNPERAQELFCQNASGESLLKLAEGDRRLLRDLVQGEFDTSFITQLSTKNYRSVQEDFLSEGIQTHPLSALNPQKRALVFWETQKNAAASRSSRMVKIENFEIPTHLLIKDLATRMPKDLRDALIFKRDGKEYVRWLINPEDTEHYQAVVKFLKKNGVSATRHQHFEAYQTASRSYIVVDPDGHRVVFSAKVSTNTTGGEWRDKKQPVQDAAEARRAVDFVMQQSIARRFRNIVVMDEPAMFGIREIDQAMLVRSLGELPAGDVTYLPGFSAVHSDLGVRIAHANGSSDPVAFWNEHYNKPLARAVAELAAKTGLTYDSPHSQNFLIEMVGVNPTGRIVMRDFGDTYAQKEFFESIGKQDFLTDWEKKNITRGYLSVRVGVLHGNKMPVWMNEADYMNWGRDFYQTFESEFSALTGVETHELAAQKFTTDGRYFGKSYSTRTPSWRNYLQSLEVAPPIGR